MRTIFMQIAEQPAGFKIVHAASFSSVRCARSVNTASFVHFCSFETEKKRKKNDDHLSPYFFLFGFLFVCVCVADCKRGVIDEETSPFARWAAQIRQPFNGLKTAICLVVRSRQVTSFFTNPN